MAELRLIDANALMKNIGKIPQLRGITYGRMKKAVEETLTIDAVPVVRCWECVHYKPKDAMTPGDNRMRCDHPCLDYDIECYDQWLDVEPNDYCKYGERKMDGGAADGSDA